MKINQREKEKPEVESGKAAAVDDLNYRYNLICNREEMNQFQSKCKSRGLKASNLIREFIGRKLDSWGE